MTPAESPIAIAEEEVRRHRWRDVDGNVDAYNATLDEWMRRGEETNDAD